MISFAGLHDIIGLTMISWVWFHTWNFHIVGNLKSYTLVSWYHIPCIWFQWYDIIYPEIMTWLHIWNMKYGYDNFKLLLSYDMISYVIYACMIYLKSYMMVLWYHIPCIWFQYYDFIHHEIKTWFHICNMDMISPFHMMWFHMFFMHVWYHTF